MKVLVTGASGYIGRHVIDELIRQGHSVNAVDIRNSGINEAAQYIECNIFSGEKDLYEKLGEPELCIHLAWRDGFVHNSVTHIETLFSHYRFLTDLANAGCTNIAVMGSMHEVGFWEGAIDEKTPCNPLSLYGIAKNALRQAMISFVKGKDINLFWLRAYYILGDDLKNNSIFTKIIQAVEAGKDTFPFTSGQAKYDFISVDELAKQIVAASTQQEYTGIINVCSGNPITLAEQVENFIAKNEFPIKLEYGAFPDRPYDSKIVYGDNTIISKILDNAK